MVRDSYHCGGGGRLGRREWEEGHFILFIKQVVTTHTGHGVSTGTGAINKSQVATVVVCTVKWSLRKRCTLYGKQMCSILKGAFMLITIFLNFIFLLFFSFF